MLGGIAGWFQEGFAVTDGTRGLWIGETNVYIPTAYEESNQEVLHALIRAHPLGAWVTLVDGEIVVNHIPFVLDANRGPHGTLVGHVARANPVWKSFSTASASVFVAELIARQIENEPRR